MINKLSSFGYTHSSEDNIWSRPEYNCISYSDGSVVENHILEVLRNTTDRSTLSPELRKSCQDWATTYHLSSERANLLRPFGTILENASVLEIGAGCGAITRFLGETGSHVVAVEGTRRRAQIARTRTSDLNNVHIVCDRFNEFNVDTKFDVVTLIGVLEYANMFTPSESPMKSMLERAKSFLKPDGVLLIAIENQLGLKYFAGSPEDHIGEPMYGIENRYTRQQPETLGKAAITQLITEAGFQYRNFLAPFPDYKLPCSIITELGFLTAHFDASSLAAQCVRRDYQLPADLTFSPELAWPTIFKNKLALDLANSFLIIASNSEHDLRPNTLAFHYSTGRAPEYCKETKFNLVGDEVTISTRHLAQPDTASSLITHQPEYNSKYYLGQTFSDRLTRLVTKDNWQLEELTDLLKNYLEIIQTHISKQHQAIEITAPETLIPGTYIDAIPQNIIIKNDGEVVIFDQEWHLANDFPLGWLIFRALLQLTQSITRFGNNSMIFPITREQFFLKVFSALTYPIEISTLYHYGQLDAELQRHITRQEISKSDAWAPSAQIPYESITHKLASQRGELHMLRELNTKINSEQQLQLLQQQQAQNEINQLKNNLEQNKKESDALLSEMSSTLSTLQDELTKKDNHITNIEASKSMQDAVLKEKENQIQAVYASTSWRMTKLIRWQKQQILRISYILEHIPHAISIAGGVSPLLKKIWGQYRRAGTAGLRLGMQFVSTAAANPHPGAPIGPIASGQDVDRNDYTAWVKRFDQCDNHQTQQHMDSIQQMPFKPLISIIMPTYNAPLELLKEAIESVIAQTYPHWELCIADDASTDSSVRKILESYQHKEKRIKVTYREQNGHISNASNSAIALATGDWIALFDQDDLLSTSALYHIAKEINDNPQAAIIYTDEDKIDEHGTRFAPHFKSDWNPDLLFSQNYVSHLGVYASWLIKKIGGFRTGVEGSQDHDLILRCLPHISAAQFIHIPKVLYHWRAIAGSTALAADGKSYTTDAGVKALSDYFSTVDPQVRISAGQLPNTYKVCYPIPDPNPLVSLLIPTRDHRALTETCVRSILEKTTYQNYEILILDNGSEEKETLEFFQKIQQEDARVKVYRYDYPFNYSAINNFGAGMAKGSIIGLVNNDIEVISANWLSEMVSHALRKEIGCVGAKLYYSDGRLQHCGVILGIGGVAGHSHKYFNGSAHGYFSRLRLTQSLSAVTAACLLVRKEVFEQVGGLDEQNLKIAFNDVDFCLKVREAGYRNIWTPYAELFHHESISRGAEDTPEKAARFEKEVLFMKNKWGTMLSEDKYYNRNLTNIHEDFSLAWPPRV
jgi:Predicted glycosyltransferases